MKIKYVVYYKTTQLFYVLVIPITFGSHFLLDVSAVDVTIFPKNSDYIRVSTERRMPKGLKHPLPNFCPKST